MLNVLFRYAAGIAALLVIFTVASPANAADAPTATVITVGEMCGGCVKKITAKFDNVKGIASVRCDIKTKMVTLQPANGYRLNPRGLWEMMDEIGKTPTKLAGPDGVFTSKPKK